jgi:hypothetical protein
MLKKFVAQLKREKMLHFLTDGFLRSYYECRFYRLLGITTSTTAEVKPEDSGIRRCPEL